MAFLWGKAGEKLTQRESADRQRVAQALMAQAGDTSPVGHWTAALNRGLQGYLGGRQSYLAREGQNLGQEHAKGIYEEQLAGGSASPVAAALAGGGGTPAAVHSADDGHDHSNMSAEDWYSYSNQGAVRNLPVSDDLIKAMAFLPELGVTMDIYSGGQDRASGKTAGGIRHDNGNAADVIFRNAEGRMLDWNNPDDLPILSQIVARSMQNGITGIGAGDDYMGAGRFHIGFGDPAIWGAGGKSANAPQWLLDSAKGVTPTVGNVPAVSAAPVAGGGSAQILAAMSDPYVADYYGPQLQAMLGQSQARENAVFQQQLGQQDPAYQLALERGQLELDQLRNPGKKPPIEVGGVLLDPDTLLPVFDSRQTDEGTSDTKNYDRYVAGAVSRGETPMPFENYQALIARAGSGSADGVGTIPAGYQAVRDPLTNQITGIRPIPGGPAESEYASAASKQEQREGLASATADTVVTAAQRALDAAGSRSMGVYGQKILSGLPWTSDAEAVRQVDTLKSIAAAENINAMRQASPTGGALGNASDADIKLLKEKSGALDPASPNFERDLKDYARTLLRTIHGNKAGDAMFAQSFPEQSPAGTSPEDDTSILMSPELNPYGGGLEVEGEVTDFTQATMDQLLNADITSLTEEQQDAWEARLKELQNGR